MKQVTFLVSTTVADLADQVNAHLADGAELHGTISSISNGRVAQAVILNANSKPADTKPETKQASKPAKSTKTVKNPNGDTAGAD